MEAKHLPRTDIIPFEAEHRFMATLHHDHSGLAVIFVKGAPERLLAMCAAQQAAGETVRLDPDYWHRAVEDLAAEGHRVLAVAMRPPHKGHVELRFDDVDHDLTFLGLVGMIDPPREEAVSAVAECQSAGIRVKMITGDHRVTARAIAMQLGFTNTRDALTGPEIEALSEPELRCRVWDIDVFARSAPEHKHRLVEALQAEGHVVAMTGDGSMTLLRFDGPTSAWQWASRAQRRPRKPRKRCWQMTTSPPLLPLCERDVPSMTISKRRSSSCCRSMVASR